MLLMRSGYKVCISPSNAKVIDTTVPKLHLGKTSFAPGGNEDLSQSARSHLLLENLNTLDLPKLYTKAEPRFHAASLRNVVRKV